MKNFKFAQNFTLLILLFTGLILLVLNWYRQNYSMETTYTYKVNSSSIDRKLLIAKQISPFKDSIITVVANHYKYDPVIVDVIDIAALANTDVTPFDAILIVHRWEAGAPPDVIQSFMDENLTLKNKIIILTTSWSGIEKMDNIDAITGASMTENVPICTERIFKKLDPLLNSTK